MVGKVNRQIGNKETGKSAVIHFDRIKEFGSIWGRMKRHQECSRVSSKV
jgi:hypothetical protein